MTSWVPDSDLQELLLTTLPGRHGDGLESSRMAQIEDSELDYQNDQVIRYP